MLTPVRPKYAVLADTYRTLAAPVTAEPPKVKGSRFIGDAFPVATVGEALERVEAVRAREHAARHWCWAYRLGPSGDTFRFNDDGEPSGSAGAPILRQIEGRDLTGVVVIVTRYFGGTKLGVGGLIRAYGHAAGEALDVARVCEVVRRVPIRLAYSHADTGPAMQTLDRFDLVWDEPTYSATGAEIVAQVRPSEAEALAAAFTEALGGRGAVERPG